MNHSTRMLLTVILTLLWAMSAPPAAALSYVMMSDEALFSQADGVVRARVLEMLPVKDGDAQTRYRLRIESVLAGPAIGPLQVLVLPGTFTAPSVNAVVPGVPMLVADSTILVFYTHGRAGHLQPLHLTLGLFGLHPAPEGGAYLRALDRAFEFGKADSERRLHAPRDAAAFERWIVDRARGEAREPDYLLDASSWAARPKFTFAVFNFSTPGPGRWFQFDSNQTMPWTAHPSGQAGAVSNVFTALQNALAAWTDDAGSRILLSYSGTLNFSGNQPSTSFCGQAGAPACFSGHVLWNDPNNAVGGTFSCVSGGTLGIGGSYVNSSGQMHQGQIWYPRFEGFVVINDGAGCSMDGAGGANGAELLAHEVGHVLGFGHSCGDAQSPSCGSDPTLNAAIMRAFLHEGGRGATLGTDDRAGAAIAYPQPGGGNVGPQVSANTPASGSSTPLGGGFVGNRVSGSITFAVSGGSGTGTTELTCSVGSGTVSITSGTPQTIAVSGSAAPVGVRFTLTGGSQSGVVNCSAVRQNGATSNFTYTFTAQAGTAQPANRVHCSGFEINEVVSCTQ